MPKLTLPTTFAFADLADNPTWVDSFWEQGYCIVRGVFSADEIGTYQRRFDRWYAEGMRHSATVRHGNKVIWIGDDATLGRYVRGMQWPSYEDEVLDSVRTDARLLQILEPLIGRDLKQIINQLHWKMPGTRVTWGLHRDRRSRTPTEAFRSLATSYVQTGLAIDRHWVGNGAMMIGPGSHRLPEDPVFAGSANYHDTMEDRYRRAGFDVDSLVAVEMEPGDVALWGPDTVHGGGINTTRDNARRLYINGYVTAAHADRGEWAFRDGQPVELDLTNPALIQFNELYSQPDVFYPDRGSAAARVSD